MPKVFQVDTNKTLTTSLVAYYKLDDAANGKRLDFYGTRDLTDTNSNVASSAGKISNAADGGTTNTNKDLRNTANNYGISGGNISVSCWINVNTQPSGAKFTFWNQGSGDNPTNIAYGVFYKDVAGTKTLVFAREKEGISEDAVSVTNTFTLGTWYHIVLTYDGTNVEGWLNGVSKGTTASSGNGRNALDTTAGLAILSAAMSSDGTFYAGLVDELGIWSKKLSNTEVADLYNGGSGQTMVIPGGISNLPFLGVG